MAVRAADVRRRHPARGARLGAPARQPACSPTPTCCTAGCCRGTREWASFLRGLRYVVVDECHTYRGVFGSHVAQVLRRLRRVCARYGADPVFVLASATVRRPGGVGRPG